MNVFEKLRRSGVAGPWASIPWGTFAAVAAQELHQKTGAAGEVIEQLKEWGAHLTTHALTKWTVTAAQATPCESPDVSTGHPRKCQSYGVVRCDVCGRTCCLAHARVDYMGDAICEPCIGEAKRRARDEQGAWRPGWRPGWRETGPGMGDPPRNEWDRPAPKPGMAVPEALKALKLPPRATWEQTKKQYRALVVQYNADKPQSDKQREKNTERLKKINEAFGVLRERFEGGKAAA